MLMTKVVIFGTGNLATHLYRAFSNASQLQVVAVWGRSTPSKSAFGSASIRTQSLSKIPKADVYFVCITDDAVSDFAKRLSKDFFVVHTSGALALDALTHERRGIFWPIQTFSKNRDVSFKQVPICIEAANKSDLNMLHQVAQAIAANPTEVNSKERAFLHVAAVFVNNFVNQLYHTASDLLETQNVSYQLLKPLILETAKKGVEGAPNQMQTGPAKRGDKSVMKKQESLLTTEQKKLYVTLSKAIYKTHNNNEL